MKFVISLLLWSILFVLCWPVALLILAVLPVIWLLSIPFRVLGAVVAGLVSLLRALFMLPARVLGAR